MKLVVTITCLFLVLSACATPTESKKRKSKKDQPTKQEKVEDKDDHLSRIRSYYRK